MFFLQNTSSVHVSVVVIRGEFSGEIICFNSYTFRWVSHMNPRCVSLSSVHIMMPKTIILTILLMIISGDGWTLF
jgi:hypothetical protein